MQVPNLPIDFGIVDMIIPAMALKIVVGRTSSVPAVDQYPAHPAQGAPDGRDRGDGPRGRGPEAASAGPWARMRTASSPNAQSQSLRRR